jgi:hypothetical protein
MGPGAKMGATLSELGCYSSSLVLSTLAFGSLDILRAMRLSSDFSPLPSILVLLFLHPLSTDLLIIFSVLIFFPHCLPFEQLAPQIDLDLSC